MDERESEAEPLGEWTMPTATISGAEAGAWRGGGGREKGGATGPRGPSGAAQPHGVNPEGILVKSLFP
jgi:hypothetical protein